jgi:hypothetical protein
MVILLQVAECLSNLSATHLLFQIQMFCLSNTALLLLTLKLGLSTTFGIFLVKTVHADR